LAQQPISSTGLPGSELDGEFARAADSINQIKNRLSEVQRDDGKLRNNVVSIESLSESVRNMLATSGARPVTWSVGGQYAVGDLVSNPPSMPGTFICIFAHTSSNAFTSDLANWALIAAPSAAGVLYTNTFIGDGSTTAFTLTQQPASKNNTQLFIDGIYQPKDGYSLSGQTLTITPAPAIGSDIEVSIGAPSTSNIVTVTDNAISTSKIEDLAVTTSKIANLSVTDAKLANGSVSSVKLADSVVSTDKLAAAAVTSDKILNSSVTSEKIAALSITSDKIVNNSISSLKLADNAVATSKIVDLAVTESKIAAGSVSSGKIADNAVTQAKANNMLLPAGAVMPFAMNLAPAGWLAANGAAVSRTTYAALFGAIGTTYGAGDNSTTFNLPDLRGIFISGSGNQTINSVEYSRTFAAKQGDTLQNITGTVGQFDAAFGNTVSTGAFTTTQVNDTTGGGGSGKYLTADFDASRVARTSTETRPANIALLYCIKA
jgi:microcystin-dependent protein